MARDERDDGLGEGREPESGISEQELAKEVAEVSPEGRPADPSVGMKQFGMLWLGLALGVVVLGVVLGFVWRPMAGIVVAAVGIVSLIVNPQVLAGVLRAKDREKAIERHEGH